jgi:DNA-binding transcriptional LysR family regulator
MSHDVAQPFCADAECFLAGVRPQGAIMDWDDLKYLLAVAESGSTLAAGKTLRVSQTTVARRIASLEASLGVPLFERRQAGYCLTKIGEELLGNAREVELAARGFVQTAAARSRDLTGSVCLTTEEIFGHGMLGAILSELHQRHPDVRIDLDTAPGIRDLSKGEADIALRSTKASQSSGVVGRRICNDDWALYCSRAYAERHGIPKSVDHLREHTLVGGGGGELWRVYEAWLTEIGAADRVAIHHDTSNGLLSAVRSGFGIAVLPLMVARGDSDLICCMPPRGGHGRTLWLLTHERVRHMPRVRVVIDFLHNRLKARVAELGLSV